MGSATLPGINCAKAERMPDRWSSRRVLGALCVFALVSPFCSSFASAQERRTYLGFDRNQYPGDEAMKTLRKDFAFAGYWLGAPPGEKGNTWQGKHEYLRSLGYGFLPLVNGRDSGELKTARDAAAKGTADAKEAAASARQEGFAAGAIVFADIEEGGRLGANYHAYLKAWAEELRRGGFNPGVYCSGIAVNEGRGVSITTADDIHNDATLGELIFWVYNDACPPSGGCAITARASAPTKSGTRYAAVWQFAQSPRRKQYTRRCAAKYAADGNCYAPSDVAHKWFLDLNSATSADPSGGAK
jgi:glycoside hydrolase-like protein